MELGSKAGALRQMLLELLEDSDRIRRMTAMGRLCRSHRGSGLLECDGDFDEQEAEEEEEEVETLLEYYLQRSAPAALTCYSHERGIIRPPCCVVCRFLPRSGPS